MDTTPAPIDPVVQMETAVREATNTTGKTFDHPTMCWGVRLWADSHDGKFLGALENGRGQMIPGTTLWEPCDTLAEALMRLAAVEQELTKRNRDQTP